MRKNRITTSVILMLGMLWAPFAAAGDVYHLSLDNSASLGLRLGVDTRHKVEGTGSVKITSLWPTTVCLGEVTGLRIENTRMIYRAQVKSDLDGQAYLEMWAHIDGRAYFSRGLNSTIAGKSDWKVIDTPFMFQRGQLPEKITLNLVINGKGTVWIDDIRLAQQP